MKLKIVSLAVVVSLAAPAIGTAGGSSAFAQQAPPLTGEEEAESELLDELLGTQTSDSAVVSDADTAVSLVEDGTLVDIHRDPTEGVDVDLAGRGLDVSVTPTDQTLGDFEAAEVGAVAFGNGYSTAAQPTEDGGFRMAILLSDSGASMSQSYDFDLPAGTNVTARADGGFDFLDATGDRVGGLAAPWGIDANFVPVRVTYTFEGNRLTRTIHQTDQTAFPVVANFCLFGSNPNGSCRNPIRGAANWIQNNWRGTLISISVSTLFRLVCWSAVGGWTITTSGAAVAAYPTLINACSAAGIAIGRAVAGYTTNA